MVFVMCAIDIVSLFLPFHAKLQMRCSSVFCAVSGMPCTLVRYCVMPPIIICVINLLPLAVGWFASHLFRFVAIFSIVGVHGIAWSTLLPVQAPSMCVGCPSVAILMFTSNWELTGFVFLVAIRFVR